MHMGRKLRGQEVLEFALISGLVFLAALGTIFLFGGKVANFFVKNSVTATASNPAPTNGLKDYTDNATLANVPGGNSGGNSGGQTVNIEGRAFHFPQEVIDTINGTLGSTGSQGFQDVIDELTKLLQENPDAKVEIKVNKGINSTSNINAQAYGGDNSGVAVSNKSILIKADNKVVMLDKQVGCSPSGSAACSAYGTDRYNRIEGTINNNVFSGTVTEKTGSRYVNSIYTASVDASDNGIAFKNGTISDPYIDQVKIALSKNNAAFTAVLKDIDANNISSYQDSYEKKAALNYINELKSKYGNDYKISLGSGLSASSNQAVLIGLTSETNKTIIFNN